MNARERRELLQKAEEYAQQTRIAMERACDGLDIAVLGANNLAQRDMMEVEGRIQYVLNHIDANEAAVNAKHCTHPKMETLMLNPPLPKGGIGNQSFERCTDCGHTRRRYHREARQIDQNQDANRRMRNGGGRFGSGSGPVSRLLYGRAPLGSFRRTATLLALRTAREYVKRGGDYRSMYMHHILDRLEVSEVEFSAYMDACERLENQDPPVRTGKGSWAIKGDT